MSDTNHLHAEHAAWDKLWELIADIRFVMFTTTDEHGGMRARPLTTQERPDSQAVNGQAGNATLWFFVGTGSETVQDVRTQAEVCLAYASPSADRYVSVSGHARIVQDSTLRHALWNKAVQAWFPDGPNDPKATLLAVDVTAAEYWDVKNSKMVQLFKMAKSVITGQPPQLDADHGKLGIPH